MRIAMDRVLLGMELVERVGQILPFFRLGARSAMVEGRAKREPQENAITRGERRDRRPYGPTR